LTAEQNQGSLMLLDARGALQRVHGGAASIDPRDEQRSSAERAVIAHDAKLVVVASIAQAGADAADEITQPEGDQTVVIEGGTSAVEVARAIPRPFHDERSRSPRVKREKWSDTATAIRPISIRQHGRIERLARIAVTNDSRKAHVREHWAAVIEQPMAADRKPGQS